MLRILDQSVSKHCRRCTIRTAADASYLIAPCCWILAQFDRVVKLFHLQLSEQLLSQNIRSIYLKEMEGSTLDSNLEEFRCEWDDEGVYFYQAYCDEIAQYALANQR